MRSFLRRYGTGTLLCALGLAVLLAGTGASLGYRALTQEAPAAAVSPQGERETGGLEATIGLAVDAPLVPLDPVTVHSAPAPLRSAPLPGASLRRDIDLDQAGAGVDASVDLAAGSHRVDSAAPARGTYTTAAMHAALAPAALPVAVAAAAALTAAGLLAYFWRSMPLALVGLYAKISRAEVFDNDVRERIFGAIRANPGVSASDLARLANVSWGTTIYHLDVLEQTRMVSSQRHGRYRRYFENGANLAVTKDVVAILQNPVTAGVVRTLRALPGVTQKELAAATQMTPQALHWHLARLAAAGVIRKEREGRVVRHFVSS